MVGIMVNEVKDVVSIAENDIEEINESRGGINQEFIRGVFSVENNLIIILNIEDILFADREKEEVKNA